MEEPEVPLEAVQEHIEHHAHMSKERWVSAVALSTAILAALAAIASLLAGDHANEGMLSQIKASNQWNYYQAKGIKAGQLASRIAVLRAVDKPVSPADEAKLLSYSDEQAKIKTEAEDLEHAAESNIRIHVTLARAVTLFQISIAIGAISVLTKLRTFWAVSLAFGAGGVIFLIQGILG